MVGSLPGGVRCGERQVVRCDPCHDRWTDEEMPGHPHPYARMEKPAGCETPDCEACKEIYIPTRAAAGALRVKHFLDQADEDIVLRHVVVSPPWDTLDDLAAVNYGPPDRDTIGELETRVNELVEKKGAVASIVVRHPWRGWWGPDRDWRESWHWHVIAAFPRETAPEEITPNGWDREFVPGGSTCCRHRDVYDDAPQVAADAACCDGSCRDTRCPHRQADKRLSAVRSLSGKLGAAKRSGYATKANRLRDRLDHAQRQYAIAKQAACDQGWIVRVTERCGCGQQCYNVSNCDQAEPIEVSDEPYTLKGGAAEGMTVPAGVLALLQYELDHAASIRDNEGSTKLHTVKWFGAWSYRNLELGQHEQHAIQSLKSGTSGKECPNCGQDGMQPVRDPDEAAKAVQLLEDPDVAANRVNRQEIAIGMDWYEVESGDHSTDDSASHRPDEQGDNANP